MAPKVPQGNSRAANVSGIGLPPVSKTQQAMLSSSYNLNGAMPLTEKQLIISKLKGQNEKLKGELKVLTSKLEEFMDKSRQKKQAEYRITPGVAVGAVTLKDSEKDEAIKAKESELKQSQNKIAFYKKEIEAMRRQLEGSYNIQK